MKFFRGSRKPVVNEMSNLPARMTSRDILRPGGCLLLFLLCSSQLGTALAQTADIGNGKHTVRTAWYDWHPYVYREEVHGIDRWTGMDVKLTESVFRNAGISISSEGAKSWPDLMDDLKAGDNDIAIGAFRTKDREAFAHYSEPYREDSISLFIPRGRASEFRFQNPEELFATIRDQNLRIGLVTGWSYTAQVDPILARPENAAHLVYTDTEDEMVALLIRGDIDAYCSGRIPGHTRLWRQGLQKRIQEHPRGISGSPVHVMFSRKTISGAEVERFNQSLEAVRRSGEFSRIVRGYLLPILLSITLETRWFFAVDIIGTIAFSLSGILLGRIEKYTLFGTFCLAALPAMGGGVIRDVMVGRHPLGVLRTPVYIQVVMVSVLLSYIILAIYGWMRRLHARRDKEFSSTKWSGVAQAATGQVVQVCDAIGLAAFTIIGVVVAVEARCEPLWLWGPFLAALTGAGGGILRDIVRSDTEIRTLKGELYPEIALIWGLAFSIYLVWTTDRLNPNEILVAVICVLFGAFLTRMAAIHFNLKSPLF